MRALKNRFNHAVMGYRAADDESENPVRKRERDGIGVGAVGEIRDAGRTDFTPLPCGVRPQERSAVYGNWYRYHRANAVSAIFSRLSSQSAVFAVRDPL